MSVGEGHLAMSNKTALNDDYKGIVEGLSIPVEFHQNGGKKFASYGTAIPIHCATKEQANELVSKTHHYCDIFSEHLLSPLGELVYVRLDDTKVEKVFVNRSKRILVISSDGVLAQWRCTPSFESANSYMAGAPLVDQKGALVSLVTVKKDNHYAISSFEGEGGYFETSQPWKVVERPENTMIYGDKTFKSREDLRQYVASLPTEIDLSSPPTPILYTGQSPRIVLVSKNGRQIVHQYLQGVVNVGVEYL